MFGRNSMKEDVCSELQSHQHTNTNRTPRITSLWFPSWYHLIVLAKLGKFTTKHKLTPTTPPTPPTNKPKTKHLQHKYNTTAWSNTTEIIWFNRLRTIKSCWHRVVALLLILSKHSPQIRKEYLPSPKRQKTRVALAAISTNQSMEQFSVVANNQDIMKKKREEKKKNKTKTQNTKHKTQNTKHKTQNTKHKT